MDQKLQKIIAGYVRKDSGEYISGDENRRGLYNKDIKQHREIKKISGDEECVRQYLIEKLTKELGYKEENIEIEKPYEAGRPKVIKPRIDVVVKDKSGNPFFFIEIKAPDKFEPDKEL